MKISLIVLTTSLAGLLPSPAQNPPTARPAQSVPWVDGEVLSYDIEWSVFTAARADFTARDLGSLWKFNLDMRTTGMVANIYEVDATIWSIQQKSPWRSLEYAELRDETKRTIRERTRINYTLGTGNYQKFRDGWSRSFTFKRDALDDVGSMLYSIRMGPWREGNSRPIAVHYASAIETKARVECIDIKRRDIGAPWGKREVIRLRAQVDRPNVKEQKFEIYLSNDKYRLPLKAKLEFYYGSFSLKLVKVRRPDYTMPK